MLQIIDSPGLSEQLKYKMKVYFWKIETSQSKCGENRLLNVLILQKIAHLNIYNCVINKKCHVFMENCVFSVVKPLISEM